MGNSTSTAPLPRHPPRSRPLKKRSIVDHPALQHPAPLPATQRNHKPASAPIPIPSHPQPPPRPPPPNNDSFAPDLLAHLPDHSTHRPIQYNSTRSFGAVRRGGPQGGGWPDDHPNQPFTPEVVRSSIPLRIPHPDPDEDRDSAEGRVPVSVVWRGGGKDVLLAGTFDPLEWRARRRLRFDPHTSVHTTTLHVLPGTYRLKFIVDDAWHCSDHMPTATDDDTGNLVNYFDASSPASSAPDNENERESRAARVMKANRRRTYPTPRAYHPPLLPPSESAFWGRPDDDNELGAGWGRGRDGVLEKWTTVVPAPLVAAAQHEEAYVAAVQAQRDARRGGAGVRGVLAGVGVPNVPGAPRLPRHLDKVILNTHAGKGKGKQRSGSALAVPETSRSAAAMEQWAPADDSSVLPVPSHVVLHHLGTSAIKNGVLAVSDTTRYNQKYITTIYYKPT